MRRSEEDKLNEVVSITFPEESYPLMYMSYWSENLSNKYKLENNNTGVLTSVISEVYKTYYNLLLDVSTMTSIAYDNTRNPYKIVVIVRYKVNGKELYLWEYYENWMSIKALNITKWIQ